MCDGIGKRDEDGGGRGRDEDIKKKGGVCVVEGG